MKANSYKIFWINSLVGLLVAVATYIGAKYLGDYKLVQNVFGTLFYFIFPGYYVSWLVLGKKTTNLIEILAFSIGFSLLVPPLVISTLIDGKIMGFKLGFNDVYLAYLVMVLVFWLALAVRQIFFKMRIGIIIDKRNLMLIGICISLFFIMSYVFSSRQDNIISGDSAYFYKLAEETIEKGKSPRYIPNSFPPQEEIYQPLFRWNTVVWNLVSGVDLVWIYRFGMVLLMSFNFIPFFLILTELGVGGLPLAMSLLSFLTIPVFVTEMNIIRPQSLLFYLTPLFLYAGMRFVGSKKGTAKWFFGLLLISSLSWKIHYLSIIYWILLGASLVIKYYKWMIINKSKSIAYVVLGGYLTLSTFINLDIWRHIRYLWMSVIATYQGIDFFRNSFGLITYGANLAILMPVLTLVLLILLIKKKIVLSLGAKLILVYCLIGVFILELLPRLGFIYVPGRIFLYMAIGWLLISSLAINYGWKKKIYRYSFYGLYLVSLAMMVYVNMLSTFHTISEKEIEAVKFLNEQSGMVLVTTQQGNYPMIWEYGNFDIVELNLDLNGKKMVDYLVSYQHYDEDLRSNIESEINDLVKEVSELTTRGDDGFVIARTRLTKSLNVINAGYSRLNFYNDTKFQNLRLFILCSRVKDKSFYYRFAWFRETNYPSLDLSKFDNEKYFNKVFDNGDAVVWEVKGD